MAKRIQNQKEEERVVSKSRPAVMNMSSFIATSSSTALSPIVFTSLGVPIPSGKPDSRMSVEPSSFDVASTSQVPLRVDGRAAGSPVASRRRKFRRLGQSCGWNLVLWRRICCPNNKLGRNTFAHGASSSIDQESQQNMEATWDHHLQLSPDTSHYMEAVFSMVRKIYGKPPGDPMEDLTVNLATWRMFMNTTLAVAVHLGKDYDTNMRLVAGWRRWS